MGDTGVMLDLARPEHEGVVIEAFGSGNLPPGAIPAIRRWLDEGKPVVLATRCPHGEVTPCTPSREAVQVWCVRGSFPPVPGLRVRRDWNWCCR